MIQVRYNMFETNSSSTCTLIVNVIQTDLDIPSMVKIEPTEDWWEFNLNSCYSRAVNEHEEEQFLGLLSYSGVKEIYVNGKLVQGDPENRFTTFSKPSHLLAKSFGIFKNYSEWEGYHGEAGSFQTIPLKDIREIQKYAKQSDFEIECIVDESDEVPWTSLRYSTMKITDEMIAHDEAYRKYKEELEREEYEYYVNEMSKKGLQNSYLLEDEDEDDDDYDDKYDNYTVDHKTRNNKKKRY